MVHGKKINIDDLITHTMPLEKINDAFTLMHEGKSIRSVVRLLTRAMPQESTRDHARCSRSHLRSRDVLFHETPQQQYTEALMRGNAMQASQVWLHMGPKIGRILARRRNEAEHAPDEEEEGHSALP